MLLRPLFNCAVNSQWVPVTKLGRLVKDMKIKSLEEIYLYSLPIKVSGMNWYHTLSKTPFKNTFQVLLHIIVNVKLSPEANVQDPVWRFVPINVLLACLLFIPKTVFWLTFTLEFYYFNIIVFVWLHLHTGVWDHWFLPGFQSERWGTQDHACSEADKGRSAHQVQGESRSYLMVTCSYLVSVQ